MEQVAAMDAPQAISFLAGLIAPLQAKITALENNVKTDVASFENKHPLAAEAIVATNGLLKKLFPSETNLVTTLEGLDL